MIAVVLLVAASEATPAAVSRLIEQEGAGSQRDAADEARAGHDGRGPRS